jgi:hypothetical protein
MSRDEGGAEWKVAIGRKKESVMDGGAKPDLIILNKI